MWFRSVFQKTLRDYRVAWEVRDDDNEPVSEGGEWQSEIGPPEIVEASWPAAKTKSLRLTVRVYRPTGFLAAVKTLDWWEARSGGLNIEEMRRERLQVPED